MPRSRRTADKTPLSRDAVLEAAITFADERGLETLSMRKLAEGLGVEAMSLYNHVTNKDDLLDGMIDVVVGEILPPSSGADWKQAMRRRAISAHEMLLRHPWASMLIVSRINVGPAMLRYLDATIGSLRSAGFSYAMTDHAISALDSHIYGFTLLKANFPLVASEYAQAAAQFLPMLPAETYPHARALTEEVISGRHSGINDFTFGLDLLLDGLEKLRTAPLAAADEATQTMTANSGKNINAGILVGIATAIAGYLPAVMAWDTGMRWIRPMGHAEEAMGRGLEAMFIGGPLLTLFLAILAGWLTMRGNRISTSAAVGLVVAAIAIAVAIVRYVPM